MDTHTFASRLKERRDSHALGLQVKESTARFVQDLLALLFPHFCREEFTDPGEIAARITLLQRDLTLLVRPFVNDKPDIAAEASQSFFAALPSIHDRLLR